MLLLFLKPVKRDTVCRSLPKTSLASAHNASDHPQRYENGRKEEGERSKEENMESKEHGQRGISLSLPYFMEVTCQSQVWNKGIGHKFCLLASEEEREIRHSFRPQEINITITNINISLDWKNYNVYQRPTLHRSGSCETQFAAGTNNSSARDRKSVASHKVDKRK